MNTKQRPRSHSSRIRLTRGSIGLVMSESDDQFYGRRHLSYYLIDPNRRQCFSNQYITFFKYGPGK